MSERRLRDRFCGAGGAAKGYELAGFEIAVGVDIEPQAHYPYPFVQGDCTDEAFMKEVEVEFGPFAAEHASPPCQDHMLTPHELHGTGWMLDHTRQMLLGGEIPWVIENVPGRGHMRADFRLCGCQFGLNIRRERWFETSWEGFQFMEPHRHDGGPVVSVVGHGTPTWVRKKWKAAFGRDPGIADYREAMGIDWMNRVELSQAIPPAYTQFIGEILMNHLAKSESLDLGER